MDFNSIFDAFEQLDDQKIDETNLLIDFSEHPLYWISGFNKVIANHLFFKKYTVKMFKNIDTNYDLETLERAGEHLMFNKAWDYIKKFNINNLLHVDCLKTKSDDSLLISLGMALHFFEDLEEYEKCILLKDIQDKVREFLT